MKAKKKKLLAALLGLVVIPVFAGGGNDIILIPLDSVIIDHGGRSTMLEPSAEIVNAFLLLEYPYYNYNNDYFSLSGDWDLGGNNYQYVRKMITGYSH